MNSCHTFYHIRMQLVPCYCFSVFDCLVKISVSSEGKRKKPKQLGAQISVQSIAIATSSETDGFKGNFSEDGQANEIA